MKQGKTGVLYISFLTTQQNTTTRVKCTNSIRSSIMDMLLAGQHYWYCTIPWLWYCWIEFKIRNSKSYMVRIIIIIVTSTNQLSFFILFIHLAYHLTFSRKTCCCLAHPRAVLQTLLSKAIQKFWYTFCALTILEFWLEIDGWSRPNSKVFITICLNMGWSLEFWVEIGKGVWPISRSVDAQFALI